MQSAFKDMQVLEEIENQLKVNLRVIDATREVYQHTLELGHGELCKGAMIKLYEKELGVSCSKKPRASSNVK